MMPQVHIIHENEEWTAPLKRELDALGTRHHSWHLNEGHLDLSRMPPAGIFYNRMSASSHTRGHRYAPELAAQTLAWLEAHGGRIVNGRRAIQLEVSKVEQYLALEAHGIRTPHTIATVGREHILKAGGAMEGPFITKHNRAGKGLGVKLFRNAGELQAYVDGPHFDDSVDGITLIQQYIEAPEPFIIRAEFIGGEFLYAVRVDTSDGFELCPADVCNVPGEPRHKFEIIEGFTHQNIKRYERFLAENRIEAAGIEFIIDKNGAAFTYDVNTNTNYNAEAEVRAGRTGAETGMGALAAFLTELANTEARTGQRAAGIR
ncbi:MAG: hypothetical protein MI753_02995 [Hyphomicrobiales bacterium]|nr:hypothetical protein [Hyphomicrobiales bacterium]